MRCVTHSSDNSEMLPSKDCSKRHLRNDTAEALLDDCSMYYVLVTAVTGVNGLHKQC